MGRLNSLSERKKRHLELYAGLWVIMYLVVTCGIYPGKMRYPVQLGMVPVVFSLIGLKLRHMEEACEETFGIKSAAKGLLMPYLWFSLAGLVICSAGVMLDLNGYTVKYLMEKVENAVTFYGNNGLWILPSAFIAIAVRGFIKRSGMPDKVWGCGVSLLFVVFCGILYYTGYNTERIFDVGSEGIYGVFIRIAMVMWRGIMGAFFCFIGELLYGMYDRIKKRKLLFVIFAGLLLAAATALAIYTGEICWEDFSFEKPYITIPAALAVTIALYIFSVWVDTIPPIAYIGRHAIIIYCCAAEFGAVWLAYNTYVAVLARLANRFAASCIHAVVLIVALIVLVFIFGRKELSFLFGYRSFEKPMVEEDFDTYD
ncbi:MAG: hypothetical protein K5686_04145 [Lachnospiraceae bacterium]|nr:hypothetical protein [Lachnospiraceae bacterium]